MDGEAQAVESLLAQSLPPAEIIVIALDIVENSSFSTRLGVLVGVGILMTIGVYGLVAVIVKLDDFGMYLQKKPGKAAQRLGNFILLSAPYLMKFLSVAGTVAMFLVGGGILEQIGRAHV